MPIHHAIWRVAPNPELLVESSLPSEQLLEEMIVAAPKIISDEWMFIGRQEDTGFGGRIDLLAIAPDGALVLIELKRNKTPREVVAQALDYAGWVEGLKSEDIDAIYRRFASGRSLKDDFRHRFGSALDEENLNQSHQIVVVAAKLDDSTERIVAYLNDRDVPINVLCFQVFTNGSEQLLSRAWLLDPVRVQANAATVVDGITEPWNGEYYCSFGEDGKTRSWEDAVRFGFICGGGAPWYSRTLQLLAPGDRVWVNIPGNGYVGVGRVTGLASPAASFRITNSIGGESPILDVAKGGTYHREYADDPERSEYFVPVRWLQTVPADRAIREIGFFGNQNTVCKPTAAKWRNTVERLKSQFPNYAKS
jgi:hypothetical protein